jgi:AhpD family alkylhydroperoxidase
MFPLEKYINSSGLDEKLLLLVRIRASQINHCAWCLLSHVEEARKAGVAEAKIDLLAAWREAPDTYSEREKAALAFTEQVTLISEVGVSDEVWEQVRAVFSEAEIVPLLMCIGSINVWNRMNVTAHTPVGQPPSLD